MDASAPIARVQSYVMANLNTKSNLSVDSLARIAQMSTRHFARTFVEWSGVTPHEFVERARVDAARALLEGTSLPLKTISFACVIGSADRMRIVFAKRLGVTPAQYRASFSMKTLAEQ